MDSEFEADTGASTALVNQKQLDCLQLVAQNYSSKEIARQLGISRFTVDQRLRIACQKLGATTRFEAARLVGNFTPEPICEEFAYQPSYIVDPLEPQMMRQSFSSAGMASDAELNYAESYELRDAQGYFPTASSSSQLSMFAWPNPLSGGESNDLTVFQRAVWILVLTIISAVAFGAFASGLEAISRLN